MANTRLELRMKKDAIAYAQGSPLLLEAYALHRDTTSGDCIAQLKWKNIDRRGVRAVMVDLITYDAFNNQINTVQYQYNGLNAAQGAEFGGKTPIIIHDDRIVRFEVALRAVSFADNSVWNAENGGVFEPLPKAKNQSLPDELCDQLARDLAKQGCAQATLYDVQTAHDLWQCGCGSWQKEGDPCLKCHIARQNLSAASDAALLQAHLDEYRIEQEKQRIEAEKRAEAERIEREKREEAEKIARQKREAEAARKKAIQKKKNQRIAAVAGIVLVLAIAIICAITLYFVPQSKYKSAMALMQSGSYDEACDAFVAMGGYRDSDYRLQQIEANRAFDAGNYDAVGDIYASLPEAYQDHAEDFIHMYNDAVALMDGGKYDEAIAAFAKLGHYSDSSAQISEANYRKAGALAADGNYDNAIAIYNELGEYSDSATLATKTGADKLYAAGSYAEAYAIYRTLDEAYQPHASDYAAMYDAAVGDQAAGQYDEAVSTFAALGSYADSATQVLQSKYLKASSLAENGKYDNAIAIYNKLGDYQDSATLATKTEADKLYAAGSYAEAYAIYTTLDEAYQPHISDYAAMYDAAIGYQAAGQYDEAVSAFSALGGYADSATQVLQSKYLKAGSLAENEKYDNAIAIYNKLGNYNDSTVLATKTSADKLYAAGSYAEAYAIYRTLDEAYQPHASDYAAMYDAAIGYQTAGQYDEAVSEFTTLGNYADSATQVLQSKYLKAGSLAENGKYDDAIAIYNELGDYQDSAILATKTGADKLYDDGSYAKAYAIYRTLDEAYQPHASDYAAMYDAAIGDQAAGQYDEAVSAFAALGNYADSATQVLQSKYLKAGSLAENGKYDDAIAIYDELGDYQDSAALATKTGADKLYAAGAYAEAWDIYATLDEAYHTHDADYSAMYTAADEARASGNYDAAYDGFAALGNYRDARDKTMQCGTEKAESLYAAGNYTDAAEVYESLGDSAKVTECIYAYAGQLREQGEYLLAAQQYEAIMDYADSRDQHYQMGLQARDNDKLADAYAIFIADPDYRDTQEAIYQTGVSASAEELYEVSVAAFTQVGAYKDAAMKLTMDTYAWGKQLYDNGEYDRSAEVFDSMGEFSDAAARANEARYAAATEQLKDGNYADAKERFTALGGYADSATMIRECDYQSASVIYRNADYASALDAFTANRLSGYKDADALMNECRYQLGAASMNDGDYKTAVEYFDAAGAYGDSREQAAECRRMIALGLAADYEAQGAYAEAYAQYEAAGETGKLPEMAYQNALCKLTESDYVGAIAWFEKAGYDYADVREQLLNIGEYYYATQQYDLAEAVYAKVVGTGAAAQRLYELGQYYELQGDQAAAGRNYVEAGEYGDAVQKAYQCAEAELAIGNWEAAKALYTQISDKMDVDDRIQTCDDEIATAAAIRDAKFTIGNYVEFGAYPQTSDGYDATAIEWLVLARDGNNALLISRYSLDAQPYNKGLTSITWENCTLRKWMNETFLNAAFSANEQAAIQSTNVSADRNPYRNTDPGNATTDKVFLLSIDEAERYFSSDDARKCQPTAYAVENGAWESGSGNCWWWLRSPGNYQGNAANVDSDGSVSCNGDYVNYVSDCVRPALWVNIDSGIF